MSITDELRKWADDNTLKDRVLPTCPPQHAVHGVLETLLRIADRIDAEHEAKVSYWQGASYKDGYDEGFASADDWLADHEDAMAEHGWVRLPLDADGVPIHVGDVMEWIDLNGEVSLVFTVEAVGTDCFFAWDKSTGRFVQKEASAYRHYYATTVKDVLRKVVTLCHNTWKKESPFHFYDVDDVMKSGNIAEYAAKLRLAEGEDA